MSFGPEEGVKETEFGDGEGTEGVCKADEKAGERTTVELSQPVKDLKMSNAV